MAKSLPRVRPGVLARSHNLLAANIAMFFIDQMLKNDDEAVSIASLEALTKEPRRDIVATLGHMQELGILSDPGRPWSEIEELDLDSFCIQVSVATRDKNGQGKLTEREPGDAGSGKVMPPKRGDLYLNTSKSKTGYRMEQRGGVWFQVNVVAHEGEFNLTVIEDPDDNGGRIRADSIPFTSTREAWSSMDQYLPDDKPPTVLTWALALEWTEGSPVLLAPSSFGALGLALVKAREDNDETPALAGVVRMTREEIGALVGSDSHEPVTSIALGDGLQTFESHEEGHAWPGFAANDSAAEESASSAVLEFKHTLEDGEVVEVAIVPDGKGFSVSMVGAIGEGGSRTWKASRSEAKEIKADAEGWSLRMGETLRKRFVDGQGAARG